MGSVNCDASGTFRFGPPYEKRAIQLRGNGRESMYLVTGRTRVTYPVGVTRFRDDGRGYLFGARVVLAGTPQVQTGTVVIRVR